jgi:hypothetical protein
MKVLLLVLALAAAVALSLMLRPGANLWAESDKRRLALGPGGERVVLTEQDIAHLPVPVQNYVVRAGAIGKPHNDRFHIERGDDTNSESTNVTMQP